MLEENHIKNRFKKAINNYFNLNELLQLFFSQQYYIIITYHLRFIVKVLWKYYCKVLIWGVLHCRCERIQTQQAQYNEFDREAGSRTGPLRGLCQRSGKIVREQDHQRRRGGVKVCPRASSEDEFFFSSSDTTRLELSGVFWTAIPFFVRSL